MPNMSKQYQLILGTFIDNEFIWHDVDSFDTLEEGYKEFKKYVNSQLKYTDEELVKVWNSGRLDIELRRGNRLLNWVGIYVREVDKLSEDEEEKADEENPEKKSTKDSLDVNPKYHGDIFVFWPDKKVTKHSVDVRYDGSKFDPEDRLFKRATKMAQAAADTIPSVYWRDFSIFMHATVDGEPLSDGYEYYKYHEGVDGTWEPVDNIPNKTKANDSDADFDHLIEWDTNEEWLNQLSPEDKEKLFTLGLNVKRHLKFHAFPETVRVNKDKSLIFPYNVPFDEWLKEKCTFFEGEW